MSDSSFSDNDINACIANIKPDLPDSKLAHVIVSGSFAETVILGTREQGLEELKKYIEEDPVTRAGDTFLCYVDIIDRRSK